MKYSKNANYISYIRLREAKEYARAIESLRACIIDVRGDDHEAVFHADLLQRIGDLQLEQGLRAAAFETHEQALKTDPASLLVRLQFAKFLSRAGELRRAIAECDLIVSTAEAAPFSESQDDLGSDYYAREAKRLREEFLLYDRQKE